MKKFKYCFLFLMFSTFYYSQKTSGIVLNDSGKPIYGVRVGIENDDNGDYSDKNGEFSLDFANINQNQNLKVYESGFQLYETKISNFLKSNKTIILKEKIIEIEPVFINPKKYKLKNYGTSNSKRVYSGYDSENRNKIFREYAIKVENKKRLKIKNINVNILSFKFDGTATLFFDIQNSKEGFPDDSQSLTNEKLALTFTEKDIVNNKLTLNVSDKNIWTNQDFFVTVRVNEDFKGKLYFGGNIFAFSKNTYYRNYFGMWNKFSVGEPSINVDVLVEK